MVLTVTGFVAVCVAYVRWCDRIVRSGDVEPGDEVAA